MDEATLIRPNPDFLAAVEQVCGEKAQLCFQCRKCANACPVAYAMDITPDRLMRLIQLGLREEALRSKTIWLCAACQACTTRCPNDIDIARIMNALRRLSRAAGLPPAEPKVDLFHRAFLRSVRRHGRAFELGTILRYKAMAGEPFADVGLGLKMLAKGKLKLLPPAMAGRREVRDLFDEGEGK